MFDTRVALPGSDRHELQPHTPHPKCHPDERHEVTMRTAHNLTDDEIAAIHGFCYEHGLIPTAHEREQRRLTLSGSTRNLESAFGVELHHRDTEDGTFCCHYGPVTVPSDISHLVAGVFGLDQRPVARPHYRKMAKLDQYKAAAVAHTAVVFPHLSNSSYAEVASAPIPESVIGASLAAQTAAYKQPPGTFTPVEVANLYGFPEATGAGQCIALIELGGGYKTADLKTYFAELGLPLPNVVSVGVNHGKNSPGSDADGEVMLDIEVAGAVAPKSTIAVYFAPNTDQGFMDAVEYAIYDSHYKPSVISISWGGPESSWTKAAMTSFDNILGAAKTKGITILAASGDNGSSDGVGDGANHVDFPASSPNVSGCGGTRLVANGSAITSETAWNDGADSGASGGGYSAQFPVPEWQDGHVPPGSTGRGVPDIAANADPDSGYSVYVDGSWQVVGGTSAVSPLVAGLVARINQLRGKNAGFLNHVLYSGSSVCRDVTEGNNGSFTASPGWDAASGLGSVDGGKLLAALG